MAGREQEQRRSDERESPNAPISKPVLDPDGSAALRDQLLTDVARLSSTDAAARGRSRSWRQKTAWRQPMRSASRTHLRQKWQPSEAADGEVIAVALSSSEPGQPRSVQNAPLGKPSGGVVANRVDKSLLVHPEPRRFRDKTHVKFVAKQPCLICGRQTLGCPSSAVRAASRARAQSERRVHRAAVPRPPSRGPPLR